MAVNLEVTYNGTANLYAIVRRLSDLKVWSTVAADWATWADGDIANYDIPLTSGGGDLYTASSEPAITTGTEVRVHYYERAGATPATSDIQLRSRRFFWSEEASSGSSISIDAYALTTLASVKRHLRITDSSDDTLLTELINAVSAEIERITGRKFLSRAYREFYDGAQQRVLLLRNRPIDKVRVAYGWQTAFTATYSGSGVDAQAGCYDTGSAQGVRLVSYAATTGVETETLLPFATYGTASALVTAIGAVSGWSASIGTDCVSQDLFPQTGFDAKASTAYFAFPDIRNVRCVWDRDGGTVEITQDLNLHYMREPDLRPASAITHRQIVWPWGARNLLVNYVGGFTSVPSDVSRVCNTLVQDAYYEGLTDRGMVKQTLGPFSWTASPKQTQSVLDSLAHYIDLSACVGGVK